MRNPLRVAGLAIVIGTLFAGLSIAVGQFLYETAKHGPLSPAEQKAAWNRVTIERGQH